jgi:hypothetical protein
MSEREQTLQKIQRLKGELGSIVVVQLQEGHYEPDQEAKERARNYEGWGHNQKDWDPAAGYSVTSIEDQFEIERLEGEMQKFVIDKPGITEPDEEKRKAAQIELQNIYQTPTSLRVKYEAGRALGFKPRKILGDILRWK